MRGPIYKNLTLTSFSKKRVGSVFTKKTPSEKNSLSNCAYNNRWGFASKEMKLDSSTFGFKISNLTSLYAVPNTVLSKLCQISHLLFLVHNIVEKNLLAL